jgi:hypothetical protein
VTSVPWQLESSERAVARRPEIPPGSIRRGYEAPTENRTPVAKP